MTAKHSGATEAYEEGSPNRSYDCPVCGGTSHVIWDDMYDDRYGYPGLFVLHACQSCGHRFIGATHTTADQTSLYSHYYPRGTLDLDKFQPYAEVRGFRAWFDGEDASAFRWVPAGVRVLDIGCGFGETLAYHQARGCDAHGVDADENILRVAERYGLKARAGLFDPSHYDAESFDYVTLDQVIEHNASPVEFLARVAAVLRPGGVAIISTPNVAGYGPRLFGRRWINWHVPYHVQHFSSRSLVISARKAGLSVVSVRTVTSSAWLRFQWLHLLSSPPPGQPSPFWDPSRSGRAMPSAVRWSTPLLERAKIFHIVTRLADGLGIGDNLLCVLRKPA